MDFSFTDEQKALRDSIVKFAGENNHDVVERDRTGDSRAKRGASARRSGFRDARAGRIRGQRQNPLSAPSISRRWAMAAAMADWSFAFCAPARLRRTVWKRLAAGYAEDYLMER
jgi:hypothetical protein